MRLKLLCTASATLAAVSLLAGGIARADEGMWQPSQLPSLATQIKQRGLALDPRQLASLKSWPLDAVVGLGFCTASFVSPDGLIVTNHHCGYGALQYNSTPEKNLIENGFLARAKADELPTAPTQRVYVTEQVTDVTDRIEAAVPPGSEGYARYVAIDREKDRLVRECTKPGYHCQVQTFSGGYDYQLVRQKELRDVRLVYAPPESIGKYGGDIDNWMWPRHTGDFSFLRAYVARDGSSATYAKDNVPYRPKHWLSVNPQGVKAGDFVMVAGYPGRTNRHLLPDELRSAIDWQYPTLIRALGDMNRIIDTAGKQRPAVAVAYADQVAGFNNSIKFYQGNRDELANGEALSTRREQEAALHRWLAAQPAGGKLDAPARLADVERLNRLVDARMVTRERDLILHLLQQTQMYRASYRIVRLADEKQKPDAEREDGFRQRDEIDLLGQQKSIDRRYDPAVDRQLLVYVLQRYVKLPADQHIGALDRWLGGANDAAALAAKVDALYAGSRLTDQATRVALMSATPAELAASHDSWIALTRALMPDLLAIEHADKAQDGDEAAARAGYMKALTAYSEARGLPVYHDANLSLRVSFGTVQGYRPRDAVEYLPFTTTDGIVQKNTGVAPFNAPAAELAAIRAHAFDGFAGPGADALPVNFLADLDIAGGNSGSPTLDRDGKLVGLVFDGAWEGVSAGWLFDPAVTRSIHVDVRYMLWVMHHLDHADNLLREMNVAVPD
ncbi:S46 family peptidase [Burkholderia gladioli]|uniref:S46 family peptidase n=1 Tax=Burkholderia gladioli TaxID=28095 RepID=UPI0016421A42|nr:S46 family peptidase [Burkholderia gladioli]